MRETHAQFEYRAFEKEKVFEIIARLHAVPGKGATELFIRASNDGEGAEVKVLRRAPTTPVVEAETTFVPGSASASASGAPVGSAPPALSGSAGKLPVGPGSAGRKGAKGSPGGSAQSNIPVPLGGSASVNKPAPSPKPASSTTTL
jgi:hypothetical protein